MDRQEEYTSLLDNNSNHIFVNLKQFLKLQNKEFYAAVGLIFFTLIFFLPNFGHPWDNQCFSSWCSQIQESGLGNAYNQGSDYPPLIHYFLWGYGKFFDNGNKIVENFRYFRIFVLCIEFIGYLLILSYSKNYQNSFFYLIILALNPAVFYDNLIWGQTDGLLTTLLLFSLFAAANQQVIWAIVFYFLAFNFKFQSGVFLPILVLLLLPNILQNRKELKKFILALFIIVLIEIIILMPFILAGKMQDVIRVFKESFSKFPIVTMNAYNFWVHRFGNDINFEKDNQLVGGLTLKAWGLMLFFISSFFALLPLFIKQLGRWMKRDVLANLQLIDLMLLSAALVNLLFFYFPTEMHERYSYPGLIFIAAYAIRNGHYWAYFLFSLALLLNMERVLTYLQLSDYHIILFNIKFVSIVYLATIVFLFRELYLKNRIFSQAVNLFNRK